MLAHDLAKKSMKRKLLNKYGGPYQIAKVLGSDRYKITTVKGLRAYRNFDVTVTVDPLRSYHRAVPGDEHFDYGQGDNEAVIYRQNLIDLLKA